MHILNYELAPVGAQPIVCLCSSFSNNRHNNDRHKTKDTSTVEGSAFSSGNSANRKCISLHGGSSTNCHEAYRSDASSALCSDDWWTCEKAAEDVVAITALYCHLHDKIAIKRQSSVALLDLTLLILILSIPVLDLTFLTHVCVRAEVLIASTLGRRCHCPTLASLFCRYLKLLLEVVFW